ncbi:hypothetical protein AB7Z54_17870 [Providencia manganoxydans]|uniref:hypothetical protein n=1 Tax=Providencia manganoxydans TaxID=2923283 RepID=UPI0032D9BA91
MEEKGIYRKLMLLNDGGHRELKDIKFPLEVECELDGEFLAVVDKSEFYFDDDELNNSRDYFIFAIGRECELIDDIPVDCHSML